MAFGFSDALGALGKGILDIASSAYNNHEARRNASVANKEGWKYYQKQKELDYQYDANQYLNLDKRFIQWQNDLAYDLSRNYAQNSAKWTMDGLRKAGINPLLGVASGLGGANTFGDVQTNSASRSGGASFNPVQPPTSQTHLGDAVFSGARDVAGVRQTLVDTENTSMDTELKQAEIQRTKVEAANAAKNGGYTSFANRIINEAKSYFSGDTSNLEAVHEKVKHSARDVGSSLGHYGRVIFNRIKNGSAKPVEIGYSYLDDPDISNSRKLQMYRRQLKKLYPDMDSRTRASLLRKQSRALRTRSRMRQDKR